MVLCLQVFVVTSFVAFFCHMFDFQEYSYDHFYWVIRCQTVRNHAFHTWHVIITIVCFHKFLYRHVFINSIGLGFLLYMLCIILKYSFWLRLLLTETALIFDFQLFSTRQALPFIMINCLPFYHFSHVSGSISILVIVFSIPPILSLCRLPIMFLKHLIVYELRQLSCYAFQCCLSNVLCGFILYAISRFSSVLLLCMMFVCVYLYFGFKFYVSNTGP